jgi:hypothetical protein
VPGLPGGRARRRWVLSATATEVASSHVVMLSQPQVVIDVIQKSVKAAQGVTGAA